MDLFKSKELAMSFNFLDPPFPLPNHHCNQRHCSTVTQGKWV